MEDKEVHTSVPEIGPKDFVGRLAGDEEYRRKALNGELWWASAQVGYMRHAEEVYQKVSSVGDTAGVNQFSADGWGVRACKTFWDGLAMHREIDDAVTEVEVKFALMDAKEMAERERDRLLEN
jgi:hypothetical protein